MTLIAPKDLVASLASTTCPACSKRKFPRSTFCGGCYHALPKDLQKRLYRRLGDGYAEAVAAAMTRLDRVAFTMPPGPVATQPAAVDLDDGQMRLFPRGHREGITR